MEGVTGWVLALMFAGVVAISYVLAQVWLWLCGHVKSWLSARVMVLEPYTSMCDRVLDARLALERYMRVYQIRAFNASNNLLFTVYSTAEPRNGDVINHQHIADNAKCYLVKRVLSRMVKTHKDQVCMVTVDVMVEP